MAKFNKLLSSMAFSPILWGIAVTLLVYAPLKSGSLSNPFLVRFLLAHESAQLVVALFVIGIFTAVTKGTGIVRQRRLLVTPLLDAIPSGGQPISECEGLLNRLEAHVAPISESYLVRRLRLVLEYVCRKGSADTIEDEMCYLANMDRSRMHAGFAFLRRLIYCVAIVALMGAGVSAAESGKEIAWRAALDLSALGLALSTALTFVVLLLERMDNSLVLAVDERVSAELVGRFRASFNPAAFPQMSMVRGLGEQVAKAGDQLVQRQVELWKETITEAQKQWTDWSANATRQLQDALGTTLAATMQDHATTLASAAESSAQRNAANWKEIQQALLQNAEAVTLQQRELIKQSEVLTQVVAATGEIEKLESELNRNLSTLAGAKNFEQTVLSLGAAIQLLNSKLGAVPTPELPKVELKAKRSTKAA